jgi:phosphate-selective porin
VTVDGEAVWSTAHPGCAELHLGTSNHLQSFRMTGPVADQHIRDAARGGPATQMVRVTGYVAISGTSPCGTGRAFVLKQVGATGH